MVPLLVLVVTLFFLFLSPALSALYSTIAVVGMTLLRKNTRAVWNVRTILGILKGTSNAMLEMTVICAAAGFVVGLVGYTGLGPSFSRVLTEAAFGSLLLLAVLTAVASTILGMGMPTTATYILLAVLVAPAMVMMGVKPILAHLFVFYFGTLAMITPPICLASYAAASIAKAPPMKVGFQAMRLGIAAYIVPFIFLYDPGVALIGTPVEIVWAIFRVLLAIFAFAVSFEAYGSRELKLIERFLFTGSGIALIVPTLPIRLLGLFMLFILLVIQFKKSILKFIGS